MDRNWYPLEQVPTEEELAKMSPEEIQMYWICEHCGIKTVPGGQVGRIAQFQCGKCLNIFCNYCRMENHLMDDCEEDWPIRVVDK